MNLQLKLLTLMLALALTGCENRTEIAHGGVDGSVDARVFPDGGSSDGGADGGSDAMVGADEWPATFGGESPDLTTDLAIDASGNLYVAGTISSPAMFGDTTVTDGGFGGSFVASYRPNGELRWVQPVGSRSSYTDNRVHVAVQGEQVIVATNFVGSVTRPEGTLQAQMGEESRDDILIAAFATDGEFRWWKRDGGPKEERVHDLALDTDGNIYIAGQFNDATQIGELSPVGIRGAGLLISYDSTGAVRWARAPGNGSSGPISAIATNGDTLVASGGFGPTEPTFSIESQMLSGEFGDTYLLALSTDDEFRWARQATSGGLVDVQQMVVAPTGSTYAVASFRGFTNVGDESFSSSGTFDVLQLAFDAAGAPLWGRSYGSDDLAPIDHGTGIALDGADRVVITGQIAGSIDFGGGLLDPTPFMSGYNAFVLVTSTSGEHVWSTAYATGAQDGSTESIAVGDDGSIYLAAPFTRSRDIDGTTIEALGGWEDGLLTRIVR